MKKRLWERGAALLMALAMAVTVWPGGLTLSKVRAADAQAGSGEETEDTVESGADSSDKAVLKSLNLNVPADSAYDQDALYTGTRSVGNSMSELLVMLNGGSSAGDDLASIYDYDKCKSENIRTDYRKDAGTKVKGVYSLQGLATSEALDPDGDGRKDYYARLSIYSNSGDWLTLSLYRLDKKGEEVTSTLIGSERICNLKWSTYRLSSWEVGGLASMCVGDFDGDGRDEIAVYAPDNSQETSDAPMDTLTGPSTPMKLQIKIFKPDIENITDKKLGEPWQTIDIAKGGDDLSECPAWTNSHTSCSSTNNVRTYYNIPYMSLAAGDINKDGIDDLLTVANFSSTQWGTYINVSLRWKAVLEPNSAFASVLDVYQGRRADGMEQIVKKRVLLAQDGDKTCALRNASATVANVTGADSNEIVIGGNYTDVTYSDSTNADSHVTDGRYVALGSNHEAKVVVGYTSAKALLADNSKAASLSYNWTIQDSGYAPLNYYNGKKGVGTDGSGAGDYDAASEPVSLDGFAAYGYGQPDTIALEGQMFELNEQGTKLQCSSFVTPNPGYSGMSDVWISDQVVGNVTNDSFGQETLYFVSGCKKSGQEEYWNDVTAVWGTVSANGEKGYRGANHKYSRNGAGGKVAHYSFAMCDIDQDSSYVQYEQGNTDVYYSDVQVLSVLQAAPVYDDLGDDYVGDAETTYAKSTGSSEGEGESTQISAGIIAGFEHETSILGLTKAFSMEFEMEVSASLGWESEKTAEKSFSTSYTAAGAEDVAVVYTVPYVRYNAKIFVPTYRMPSQEEFYSKQSFFDELEEHLIRYNDLKANVTDGKYHWSSGVYNSGYTTDVTKENYEYQTKVYQQYMNWLETTQDQISASCNQGADERFHFTGEYEWGQEIEGGWEDYFYCIPQTPIVSSVSVDRYEEVAKNCMDLNSLYGTALPSGYRAGDPSTYAEEGTLLNRTTAQKDTIISGKSAFGGGEDRFVNVTPISSPNTSVTQSIEFNEENAITETKGIGVSAELKIGVGHVTGGVSFSADHEASKSSSTTEGCSFEGTVPNLPQRPAGVEEEEYDQYSYDWKLVSYAATVNGGKVPVVGYYTKNKNTQLPPSGAVGLELEDVKSNSVSFTWNAGKRPADHYNIYQVSGSKNKKTYEKLDTIPAAGSEDGTYHFTHKDLQPEETYTYVVRAYNEDESLGSVYTEELTVVIPVPAFDVTVGLEGVNDEETCLAGSEKTLKANLLTENYKDSYELDRYIWQVNDGTGWKRIRGMEDEDDSYTFEALAGCDGYQYRCGANVVVKNLVHRLYSDPVTLHVRKADAKVSIKADKSEGAADPSCEFGLAAYGGDILTLTAQVETEEGGRPEGSIEFVLTDNADAANVRKYSAEVSKDGAAEVKCTFAKAGQYTVTANYEENERVKAAVSENSLPYYAYDISQKEEREQGRQIQETIETQLEDINLKNAIENKENIAGVNEAYEACESKDFVETEAKKKLEDAKEVLEAAETLVTIDAATEVAVENAAQQKQEIAKAREDYEKLNDTQKELLKAEGAEEKLKNAEDKVASSEAIIKIAAIESVAAGDTSGKKKAVQEAEAFYNALTEEQKLLVPDAFKKALADAKAAIQKPTDGTENLTQTEKKQVKNISGKLGISQKAAVQIWKFADQMKIDNDTLLLTEKTISAGKSENDIKGSKFGTLKAKAATVNSNQMKLTWKKVKGADGYLIYQAECGSKKAYKKCKEIKGGSTTSCTIKKLKKGKGYRFFIRAYKKAEGKKITIAAAKSVHIVTSGGKKANVKSIKVNKTSAALKKGKTLTLKASEVKQKKPYAKCRKLSYESSNTKIATVSKAGKVTAKAKGKCTIYVYAQNGIYKEVKITVK